MKSGGQGDTLSTVPITDNCGSVVGQLRPITRDFLVSVPGCARLIARWRNENPTLSAQAFTATEQGTISWLENQILARSDRLLFLILLNDGTAVGHIGYSNFDYARRMCEVDAVLRGEKSAPPGTMTFALHALIRWGLDTLKLNIIRLRVFADNTHAIEFYKRNGFVVKAENLPAGEGSEKAYTLMQLDIPSWRQGVYQ
ncbi:GNAT family N-acetyltransferase [Acetanaerobacterium elongatum]|nr:GNAT family N-acetyltransferase [Acetanaerobacterium elongatum]